MTEYVVEGYLPRLAVAEFTRATQRARVAASELNGPAGTVRYLHSIFVPEDETCFHVYAASSVALVRAAVDQAGLVAIRISQAITAPAASQREPREHAPGELGA